MKITPNDANTVGVHQKRRQLQFRFNLDMCKPDEQALADDIESLKSARQFRPTILKALRLFLDLKDGYLDMLYDLFPEVVQRIQADYQNAEIEALRREIADLKAHGLAIPTNAVSGPEKPKIKLVKGIQANVGANFKESIGGYFD